MSSQYLPHNPTSTTMVMPKENDTLWLQCLNNYTKFVMPSAFYVLVKQYILLFCCANPKLYIAKGLSTTHY